MNRIAKSAIDWNKLYPKVTQAYAAQYRDVKARNDNLLAKMVTLPPSKPTINWSHYRKIVTVPGLVDKLQKEYEAFSVPEPKDTDNWMEKLKSDEDKMKEFVARSNKIDDFVINSSNVLLGIVDQLPKENECSFEIIHAFYPERTNHDKVNPPNFPPVKDAVEAEPRNRLTKPFWRYTD